MILLVGILIALAGIDANAATYTVTNTNDSGSGSLREAITSANSNPPADEIHFSVAGTIVLASPLPALTDHSTSILGNTAPDPVPGPDIELACAGYDGLVVDADSCNIYGLAFSAYSCGILVHGAANRIGAQTSRRENVLRSGWIGVELTGSACHHNYVHNNAIGDNYGYGIRVTDGACDNRIGGDIPERKNVVFNNTVYGIYVAGDVSAVERNHIAGNIVGADDTGMSAMPNGIGIHLTGMLCRDNDVLRNLVSGNNSCGISLNYATENVISDNYVGVDSSGTGCLGNHESGISIFEQAADNEISRNVISCNYYHGVFIEGLGADRNLISHNLIGLGVDGTTSLGNGQDGIHIVSGAAEDRIENNIISSNGDCGVRISGLSTDGHSLIENRVGTDAAGQLARGNQRQGVRLELGTRVNLMDGNLVSGNGNNGILITGPGTNEHELTNNYVGTDVTGMLAISNGDGYAGICLEDSCWYCSVGPGNLVSGHDQGTGIRIRGSDTRYHDVFENVIGLTAAQDAMLGNQVGVRIEASVPENTIGPANVISGNSELGVFIGVGASGNTVTSNRIGTESTGTIAYPNHTGIALRGVLNEIAGNQVSANAEYGIRVYGDDDTWAGHNWISSNEIGGSLGNGADGINLDMFVHETIIGGADSSGGNVIVGNGRNGIKIGYAYTEPVNEENYVIGPNRIAGNGACGVLICCGSTLNRVEHGEIWGNATDGICVQDSAHLNVFRENSITANVLRGIWLRDQGNDRIPPPIISSATTSGASGVTDLGGAEDSVEVFYDDAEEGRVFIGSVYVPAGDSNWSITFSPEIPGDVFVTATNTGDWVSGFQTSPFSQPYFVPDSTQGVVVDGHDGRLSGALCLVPAGPNPFRTNTAVVFAAPQPTHLTLRVFDIGGRLVRVVADGVFEAGTHTICWDGRGDAGRSLDCGTYLMEARYAGRRRTDRVILIRP